jgi:hypothetical protein
MNNLKSFLVPPINFNSANDATTADEIREEMAAPVRDAYSGSRRDAISYLVHNATCSPDERIDVKRALNIRWNMKWAECDSVISEVKELAEKEIERVKTELQSTEQKRIHFENLVNQFAALNLEIQQTNGSYNLIGLNEQQLGLCADILTGADQ